ncbi:hypothetical protein MUK42_16883 [Musa troglodytarum]|uniref:Uncharacterized protein n=1 Tax=Musa troglodytarum TaxID=320322 RepID=A0A9E7KYS1_9LILI|nr:hypothetical protein MUK42_16883 [Musa troglodytarum]
MTPDCHSLLIFPITGHRLAENRDCAFHYELSPRSRWTSSPASSSRPPWASSRSGHRSPWTPLPDPPWHSLAT